ncbi:hypothetical protein [Burkholderia vietnamiensis]|uniref:hypothetical protein n=1 Tax=Burkholderia vietnamiensis TaxID=60552 RepID=UPI001B981165|nr:hypothetical protein [Burkholderia vietnamiensis]MBR7998312.1 hypothetical protein [Burkholderia vietnamiensis]
MIDQDKMRFMATRLRAMDLTTCAETADAIDALLAEVEAANQKRKEAQLDAEKARDERNRVHVKLNAEWIEKTNALRAELEAAAADKRDGHRYRELLGLLLAGDIPMSESSISLNVCGVPPDQDEFDEAVAFLLAQRQGEGS